MRATREASPLALARRHWCTAQCSESTGTMWPAPGRASAAWTTGPPAISDSLLASARRRPAASVARVTSRPAKPTTAFTQTSASVPMAASASGPARSSVPAGRRAARSATLAGSGSASTTASGRSSRACSARSSTDDMAASATTRNRSGSARTTSSVCVPIDPVEPATATVVVEVTQLTLNDEEVADPGDVPDCGEDEQEGVEAIEQATMAGQQRAHVLDAQVPLQQRLAEIPERGDQRGHQTDLEALGDAVERGGADRPERDAGQQGHHHAADQALDRLVGARG